MKLSPINQTKLYSLDSHFNEFVKLYDDNRLPNKILLSGLKGIGKCTLAFHLINYILSKNEDNSYNHKKFSINPENRSFKLILSGVNPNFNLIDISSDKKNIDINQIRNLIQNLNKSSFNTKPRFVLIDNIEYLNLNSVNALLKTLEEPNDNIHFILIHSNKKVISTLLSRCLNFKISLNYKQINEINKNLFNENINDLMNYDLINYYNTPGNFYNLLNFSKDKEINLKDLDLKDFLSILIKGAYFKEDIKIKNLLYDMIEFFLLKKISIFYNDLSSYFLKRIEDTKKFNLDEESLFLEFQSKLLNE